MLVAQARNDERVCNRETCKKDRVKKEKGLKNKIGWSYSLVYIII